MAYAQWVTITLNPIKFNLTIKNVSLKWGKFYKTNDKDIEISKDEIENVLVKSKAGFTINSCGRSDAASGTEGSFDIYDGDTLIGNYYWDCPWGQKGNISSWTSADTSCSSNYITEVSGGNVCSGALGNITIKCVKF